MPSRMLVALTAFTASAGTPAAARASRIHAQIRSQLPVVSNSCEPGTPSSSRWVYSRCPLPAGVPSGVNSSARQLPVPASTARSNSSFIAPSSADWTPRAAEPNVILFVQQPWHASGDPNDRPAADPDSSQLAGALLLP